MRLTPLDIQQMMFKTAMRGYDKREVQQFQEELAQTVEQLVRENTALRDKLVASEAQLAEVRKTEHTLTQTLLTTQTLADDIKTSAQRDAQLLVKEAELKAAELLREARQELAGMQRELSELRKQRLLGIERLRSTLRTFERMLEIEEEDDDTARTPVRADKLAGNADR
jgi:cell division initiation protein